MEINVPCWLPHSYAIFQPALSAGFFRVSTLNEVWIFHLDGSWISSSGIASCLQKWTQALLDPEDIETAGRK